MSDDHNTPAGLRDRLTRQGEDALGRFAQDLLEPDPAWDVLAHDLESAAVLAAAARAGVRAATLVAIQAPGEDDAVAERLGRAALAAIPATS